MDYMEFSKLFFYVDQMHDNLRRYYNTKYTTILDVDVYHIIVSLSTCKLCLFI